MINRKFLQSSFIYTFSSALPLASALVLLPFYYNMLALSLVGLLALYISFTALIQIIANFGLDAYIGISYFHNNHDKELLKKHIGSIIGYLSVLGILLIVIWALIGSTVFRSVFGTNGMVFYPFGFISIITAICNSFFKTYSNLLINQQKPVRFFVVNLANFFMTTLFSIGALYLFPNSLTGPLWGRLLSGIGILIIALVSFHREFGIRVSFDRDKLKRIFSIVFPITLFFLLIWTSSYIDRFIINYFLQQTDIALFDFGIKCTLLIEFLHNGLSSSIMPKVYSIVKENGIAASTPEINKYFSALSAIMIIVIPINYLVIPYIVPFIVLKPEVYKSFVLLPILSMSFFSRPLYSFYLMPIYYFEKTRKLPWVLLKSTAIQIGLIILGVRYFGTMGAAIAFMLSGFIQIYFLKLESQKVFRFTFNHKKMIYLPLIYIAISLAIEIIAVKFQLPFLRFTEFFIALAMVFYLYKAEIVVVFKLFYEKLGITSRT